MKLIIFILFLFFADLFAYEFSVNENGKTRIEKKINSSIIRIDFDKIPLKNKAVCFYDDFYNPQKEIIFKLKIDDVEIGNLINLYCLFLDVDKFSIFYREPFYVFDGSGGDAGYTLYFEIWFNKDGVKKSLLFSGPEKHDTTVTTEYRPVVYE